MITIDTHLVRRARNALTLGATAVAAVLCAPSAMGQEVEAARSNTPVLTVPLDTSKGPAIVMVRIDGSRELRCIFDTGMPEGIFLIDPAVGEELGLEYSMTVPIAGAGSNPETAHLGFGVTLQLGELEFTNERVIVMERSGGLVGLGFDGAIGASVLNRYVTELDYDTKQLTLYEPEGFDDSDSGAAISLSIENTKPYIEVGISINGKPNTAASLLVDSGSSAALSLNTSGSRALETPAKGLSTTVMAGVGGDVDGVLGRTSRLALGPHELTDIVSRFPDEPQNSGHGTLGSEILRRFVTTFDYPNKRMMLRPGASFARASEANMAGLMLRPQDGGRLRVHRVIDASPAAEADVRKEDVIVAINGRAIEEISRADRQKLFEQHGETIMLTLDRDGEQVEISLELKRLI